VRQFLADLLAPVTVVTVGYGLAVIVNPIKDKMDVRVFLVEMPGNDVLCTGDPHPLHVIMGDSYHHLVG
jgi:hypothetical protein